MNVTDRVLLGFTALGMVAVCFLVFLYIPDEKTMGFVQRIFYIHVPSAWTGFLGFTVTAFYSVKYLKSQNLKDDRMAAASAEVGLLFTTLVLLTGPLWARPVWGIWWAWDVRLTSTLVLWLIYLAYVILRGTVPERDRRATLSAVTGICGWLSVPIVYMGNRVKASQHPAPVIAGGEDSGLAPIFRLTLFLSFFVLLAFYIVVMRARARATQLEDRIEELTLAGGQ